MCIERERETIREKASGIYANLHNNAAESVRVGSPRHDRSPAIDPAFAPRENDTENGRWNP